MLLECYFINEEGEELKIEPEKAKITHSTLAIVISHTHHYIYVFQGSKVTIVQKFASARRASALRLQQGYKTKIIEELEGIDADFQPILDYLGGVHDDGGSSEAKPVEAKKETPIKEVPSKVIEPQIKEVPKAIATTTMKATTTKSSMTTENSDVKALQDLTPKLSKIVKTMMTLEPPALSSCDYLIVGNTIYLVIGDKSDLRKGDFALEELDTLPEGVFPAENYYPRILISKKKVLGIELWAKRN
ncbi:MAG: hypothetical protein FK734_09685 [Asgard group archaeon]|nr:hypothetical protein [Asgard group archaeon]